MTQSSILPLSYKFDLPAHPVVTEAASKNFNAQVDYYAGQGAKLGGAIAQVPKFLAKVTIGERTTTSTGNATPTSTALATPSIQFNEGAVGNTLISIQAVLAEAGALIGALAGVLKAGGQIAVGASTTNTVASHAEAGKHIASFAASVAIAPVSGVLNWVRLAVAASLQILPPIGTAVGGAAGTAIGTATSILAGLGSLLNSASGSTGT